MFLPLSSAKLRRNNEGCKQRGRNLNQKKYWCSGKANRTSSSMLVHPRFEQKAAYCYCLSAGTAFFTPKRKRMQARKFTTGFSSALCGNPLPCSPSFSTLHGESAYSPRSIAFLSTLNFHSLHAVFLTFLCSVCQYIMPTTYFLNFPR